MQHFKGSKTFCMTNHLGEQSRITYVVAEITRFMKDIHTLA